MSTVIRLGEGERTFLGGRFLGRSYRALIERALDDDGDIHLDFSRRGATQSFLDELLGVVVAQRGGAFLDRVVFVGCTDDVRALLEFVIGARIEDHERLAARGRAASRALRDGLPA